MKHLLNAILVASVLVAGCDDDEDRETINNTDKTFVEQAALGNKTEIKFGQLATDKGTDAMVRDFGQHMIDEHGMALDELDDIADDFDNINWPNNDMDAAHQQIYDQLQAMSGEKFDSAYIKSQINDHETTVALFEKQANSGTVQRVKDYANKYLPHIRQHLDKADSIHTVLMIKDIGG